MSADFWNMGGYALFVWGSYGAAAAVFAWNLLAPRVQRREVLRRLQGEPGIGGHQGNVRPDERPRGTSGPGEAE